MPRHLWRFARIHNADHDNANEGSDRGCISLKVARQAAIATDPGECPFSDPPFIGETGSAQALNAANYRYATRSVPSCFALSLFE